MNDPDDTERDDAALAAEFALHLLDAAERAAFERRLTVEPELQALVREWDEGFVGLADGVAPVKPPRRLKSAINNRLHGAETSRTEAPLWLRWRLGIGGFALVALVGLAVLMGNFWTPEQPGPTYRAEVAAEDGSLRVLASLDASQETLQVKHVAGRAPDGRVLELWLIAKDATAPVSLGVIAEDGTTALTVPETLRDKFAEAVLAISDEPPGGSPTGAPTGTVLAVGPVTLL